MQPARLKTRPERPAPDSRSVTTQARPAGPRPPGRSGVAVTFLVALALVLAGCAGVAGYFLHAERAVAAALREERVALELAHEERIRALTRRLVSVMARQQAPGSDAPDAAFADLITRQVDLETRQAALGGLLSQLTGSLLPDPAQRGAATGTLEMAGAALLERLGASLSAGQRAQVAALLRPGEALPAKDRIEGLGQSLDRVESAQNRLLAGLGGAIAGRTQEIRTAVAELGLDLARVKLPTVQPAMGGPFIPLSASGQRGGFEQGLAQLDVLRTGFLRWRELAGIIPFQRPLAGDDTTTSNFGTRTDPFTGAVANHGGMDFRAETGVPVHAAGTGKVLRAEVAGGYGNLVELDHGNGLTTRYGHLSAFEVKPGQIVARGAVIGRVGSTGRSTGPHLHYETRRDDEALNPLRFIQAGARLAQPRVAGAP